MQTYFIVTVSVLFNTFAQLLLKYGLKPFAGIEITTSNMLRLLGTIFTNWYVLGGMCCFVASVFLWFIVLTKLPVSIAYPMGSLGYLFTLILGYLILNEPITLLKIIGVILICLGVVVLSQSH